jgi:hypothetical protein
VAPARHLDGRFPAEGPGPLRHESGRVFGAESVNPSASHPSPSLVGVTSDEEFTVDGGRMGVWVRAGHEHWGIVGRAWTIFARNTTDLVNLLNAAASNPVLSLQLMQDGIEGSKEYWDALDQRLHNQVASVGSLIDHTRNLMRYFHDVSFLVEEFNERNRRVREMPEASFLRDLRNYLLHYGAAPRVQTLDLVPPPGSTGYSFKLSAPKLLEWEKWSAPARAYLSGFGESDGPILGSDVVAYANAMQELFTWLFEQRVAVFNDPRVLVRFRMEPQDEVVTPPS